ncbi:DMT family transporter [Flavobacterium gawalongense]|uniref:EamA family transporter n=1 Tax=Flavobacterium gawalongense TaxID=2594432 RepID=A0A553BTG6_9FLAO|nr:EamA family transporter [Flavobacterium gawalongense]TRX02154.1 EamA family transporter [Flavobacterium gawalongense]TRX07383.1 EamA family transporter [Flavobacterium gawalongense]TRX11551.1 EamA family transporter [Flavobacterium gawalongense]TRX12446.1 EamA family transporter [Flavobacterium gawalongense]TRX30288.1 EamA family transporter [Flavobacterium gawalongense]
MRTKIKNAFSSKVNAIGLPILALCWVSFFWGTTWIASKEGVKHMPALQLAAIRQFIGGFLYISFFLFKKTPWPKGKQWKTIIILSILNFVLSNGLSTWGVKYISSGLGAIIGAIVPLWIVIITFFRGERLARLAVIGLIVSFGGVCVIFYDHLNDFLIPDFRFGIFISIISTLTWAFGSLYTKKKAASFNPYFSLGLQMFLSSILLFAYTGATGTSVSLSSIPAISWWSIAYLVVFGSVLTFIAFIYALQNLPAEISSIYAYINPIIAVILGSVIFGESLTTAIAIGGTVTLSGLYMVNYSLRKGRK